MLHEGTALLLCLQPQDAGQPSKTGVCKEHALNRGNQHSGCGCATGG